MTFCPEVSFFLKFVIGTCMGPKPFSFSAASSFSDGLSAIQSTASEACDSHGGGVLPPAA